MPNVIPVGIENVAGQVGATTQPSSTQMNLRQMLGMLLQWNPDLPAPTARVFLQNAYRRVVDSRNWYGLMVRGQVAVPQVYTTGTTTFVYGSPNVVGSGTLWDQTFVGRQIRAGFSTGWYNIQSVQDATHLTLDLPWGNISATSGYQICKTWVSLGPNLKMILEMLNQRQGWRLYTNWPQSVLNQYDVWRTTTGWTFAAVPKEPTADGQPQFELYPSPTFQQAFPFLAYRQPPDFKNDGDFPLTFIRSDIIVAGALKDALLFRGKNSKYYDPQVAEQKEREFNSEIEKLKMVDDNQYPKDFGFDSGAPFSQMGAQWLQSHAGAPGEYF